MQQVIEKPKQQQEKLTNIPAANSYAPPPPKIEPQTIPKHELPKPISAIPKPEQKPIPKETQIILDGLREIEGAVNEIVQAGDAIAGILFAMQQKIQQQYGPVDYKHISYAFTPDLADKLNFSEKDGYWIIKPKTYLNEFSAVKDIVVGLGGEYISAGKDSHFRVKIN